MDKFTSVSIIIPAINETDSLRKVINVILKTCDHNDIEEFFIVVCDRTTLECLSTISDLVSAGFDIPIRVYKQSKPFLGPAVHESIKRVKANHAVCVAADGDTDPNVVKDMIRVAKKHPHAQICASRWLKGGGFEGYGRFNKLLNYLFQKWLQILFFTSLTDITYGYRLFPVDVVLSVTWDTDNFPFGLEIYLKCLRLGYEFVEIPAIWRIREQGESQNSFFTKLKYIKTALKVRFAPLETIKNLGYAERAN